MGSVFCILSSCFYWCWFYIRAAFRLLMSMILKSMRRADALAGACLQGKAGRPVILTDGADGAGIRLLKSEDVSDFIIFGGTSAVSEETAAALEP